MRPQPQAAAACAKLDVAAHRGLRRERNDNSNIVMEAAGRQISVASAMRYIHTCGNAIAPRGALRRKFGLRT